MGKTFGESMREQRKKCGMTQKEFSKRLGISSNTLIRYETEAFVPPEAKQRQLFSNAKAIADAAIKQSAIDILSDRARHTAFILDAIRSQYPHYQITIDDKEAVYILDIRTGKKASINMSSLSVLCSVIWLSFDKAISDCFFNDIVNNE